MTFVERSMVVTGEGLGQGSSDFFFGPLNFFYQRLPTLFVSASIWFGTSQTGV